jgi:ElaB/YqjD/DUF883 family membrane-anchored ribosome-binding protein
MNNLKDKLTGAATSLGESASGVADDLQSRAKDAWDSVQHQTDRVMHESSAYFRKNPLPAALAAFGFGLVLGLILHRREPKSFTDRYIAGPLHQSRGVLLGLLIACGTLLRRAFSSASSAAEDAADNVGDGLKESLKPLRRTARQTRRKISS